MAQQKLQRLLSAMKQELEVSRKKLQLKGNVRPYLVSYQVRDILFFNIWGKYGALYESEIKPERNAYVEVRVGSYKSDQSIEGGLSNNSEKAESYNWLHLPLEEDDGALRYSLWRLTEMKFREALDRYYFKKRTMVVERVKDTRFLNYARSKPVQFMEFSSTPTLDKDFWEDKVRSYSSQFRKFPFIMDPYVQVRGQFSHKIFVNTEGTTIIQPFAFYNFIILGWVLNREGRYLHLGIVKNFCHMHEFPPDRKVLAMMRNLAAKLDALRKAPELPPYTGPALLSPRTAGLFFHEAMGHRLEGERLLDPSEGQTFREKMGEKILPSFLTITDDPTLKSFDGESLYGHYRYDDEGVPAEGVNLVERGVLKNFLLSRKVPKPFKKSNGHGRNQYHQEPVSRMSNLVITTEKGHSREELKEKLRLEALRQGKPYGIFIHEVEGGETQTDSYDFQAFKGNLLVVTAVDARTGKEQIITGVDFIGTPLVAIQKIIAAGSRQEAENSFCCAESGEVPVSIISPSILVSELELQRAAGKFYHKPIAPFPIKIPDKKR